jgi:ketosteroid isomerase-like protein
MNDAELRELADKQAIRDLIYTYCRAVDREDVALGYSVWHEDGQADYGATFFQGRGKDVIDFICRSSKGLISQSHQVTNILIELAGDHAGSEAYISSSYRLEQNGQLMHMGVWARYLDSWDRRDGRWGLAHRKVIFDHDELRPVTPMGRAGPFIRDRSDPSYAVLQGK